MVFRLVHRGGDCARGSGRANLELAPPRARRETPGSKLQLASLTDALWNEINYPPEVTPTHGGIQAFVEGSSEETFRSSLRGLDARGNLMVNVAPRNSFSSARGLTVIVPPCRSIISFATHKPSPIPVPRFLEKNGSKILLTSSAAIPGPSSATAISIVSLLPSGTGWMPMTIARRGLSSSQQ
jgi:hypothetical protein